MGMFDEIIVKKALPLPPEVKKLPIKWSEQKFQTKDLENLLSEYFIDKKGHLYEVVIEREYIEWTEEEKAELEPKPWLVYKDSKEISRHNKLVEYHGILRFYDYIELDPEHDAWLEFEAYFIYGKLDKILLKEFRKETAHSIRVAEWQQEQKQKDQRISNKIKKFLRRFGWHWLMLKLAKLMARLANFFTKLQWVIYKHLT